MIAALNRSACPLCCINAAIKVSAEAISLVFAMMTMLMMVEILVQESLWWAEVVMLAPASEPAAATSNTLWSDFFQLVAKFSVFLVFSKCISVFCHACSWLAGVWLTTQKAPVAANTKYISLIFFR